MSDASRFPRGEVGGIAGLDLLGDVDRGLFLGVRRRGGADREGVWIDVNAHVAPGQS